MSRFEKPYRGRLAPSPTGYLHLGHARTFWTVQERARANGGILVLRNEDLDHDRCKPEFVSAMIEDLHWFGFEWEEGPDCGGPFAPYNQSERLQIYRAVLEKLRSGGYIYPCTCSRKDIQQAVTAPHVEDDEPIYPGTCRQNSESEIMDRKFSWRFRVPDEETVSFNDRNCGP
ncbi:MAG TPA: glutamate--tRNA ligase family protein, partial [Candidatus Saccharimonadales bacterium]|nr:glutamate--tRNA ligase family protein [Candidatus Saccharimonadales bacterium]